VADLLQILRGTSTTVTVTFQVNGVGQNLDSGLPVVTLTRPDGTAGPASGTVTSLGAGAYSFVAAAQAEVTWLDYTAVGTVGGQPQTLRGRVEWVGASLFTIAELRGLRLGDATPFSTTAVPLFTDAQLHDARTAILDEFETILGFSPVPRFAREAVDGDGRWSVHLPHLKTHRLISVTVNGVTQPVGNYTLRPSGILEATSNFVVSGTFTGGSRNVVVEYAHGWERVEGVGRNAAMVMAAAELVPDGLSNAGSVTTPDGISYVYEPSEVGRSGYQRHTGIRRLDRWLNRHGQAGFVAV
jgi:hypothetical protein